MATDPISGGERNGIRQAAMPTDDDLYWPQAMRDVQTGVLRSVQFAAGGLLVWMMAGWVAIVFALIMGVVGRNRPAGVSLTLWLLPLLWWSLAAIWALRVFTVRRYRYFANSPDSTRKAVERIGRKKSEHLYWAVGLWGAGMLSLICAIIYEAVRSG